MGPGSLSASFSIGDVTGRGFVEASAGFLHLPDRGVPLLSHQELQQLQDHVLILCAGETDVKSPSLSL